MDSITQLNLVLRERIGGVMSVLPPVCFPQHAQGQHVFNLSLDCHSDDCTEHSTLF